MKIKNMKPRELLLANLNRHVIPFLQSQGFRFSSSKIHFSRIVNDFKQTIDLQLDRWNSENDCHFWSGWNVYSAVYAKWYKSQWGEAPKSDAIGGSAEWNIPGWTRGPGNHHHLTNSANDETEMNCFVENIKKSGLPFLQHISSWIGAAEATISERWMFDRAADFLMIAGQQDKAHQVLLEGIKTFTVDARPDNFQELPRIQERLRQYFKKKDT